MTEKGKLYQLGLLQSERTRLEVSIRDKVAEIKLLLDSGQSSEDVNNSFAYLDQMFREFMVVHSKCQILLTDEENKSDESRIDRIDKEVFRLKRIYQERVREDSLEMPHVKSDNSCRKKEDQASQVNRNKSSLKSSNSSKYSGSRHSRSTISERLIEEKAKLAELKLDAIFIQKQKEHELESARLENQLKIAKAKMRIYEGEIDEFDDKRSLVTSKNDYVEDYVFAHLNGVFDRSKEIQKSQIQNSKVDLSASKFKLPTTEGKLSTITHPKQQDLKVLGDMFGYLQAPTVELDVFSGNALDFEYFMTLFAEAVEKKISDPQSCLTRLLKYLDGEAKELVKGCIHLPPNESFIRAKELLTRRYGDKNRIASQYMKELKNLPKLKSNDSSSFKRSILFC